MTHTRKVLAAAVLLAAGFGNAQSAMSPMTFPQETRLIQFVFDKNRTYNILTRPNATTNIQLSPGETMTAFALGDTVQWIYDQAPGHIFIKPTRANLFTSATLVTNKRSYQLQLRSSPSDGNWYQRVTWNYPRLVIARKQLKTAKEKENQRITKLEAGQVNAPDSLDFNYKIKGRAGFKPISVFNDGRFTWLKLPANAETTPAVFLKRKNKLVLVNYTVRGDFIVVQRLANTLVLKAGDSEVIVRRSGFSSGWSTRSYSPHFDL